MTHNTRPSSARRAAASCAVATARCCGLVAAVFVLAAAGAAGTSSAALPAPGWTIDSIAVPTNFATSENEQCTASVTGPFPACDVYRVTATEAGEKESDGSAVTLRDVLPSGLTVQRIALSWSGWPPEQGFCDPFGQCGEEADLNSILPLCTGTPVSSGTPVTCRFSTGEFELPSIKPDDTLTMTIYVTVNGATGSLSSSASIGGGGAPTVDTGTVRNSADAAPPPFGPTAFSSFVAGSDGRVESQAGAHPYEYTTRIDLASQRRFDPKGKFSPTSVQDLKDVVVDLPLGFLGNAQATPTCTLAQLSAIESCPASTRVGKIRTDPKGETTVNGPLYNIVPEHGVAAEFGFIDALKAGHVITANVVPTSAGYVLRATAHEVPQVPLTDIVTTFFGNPASKNATGIGQAMFTNPSDCSAGPPVTGLHVDSWQSPGRFNPDGTPDLSDPRWVSASTTSTAPITGCNLLAFSPTISVQPDTTAADSPAGLAVTLRVPQSEDSGTLASPPLRTAVVTLPQGFTVDPSSANGLGACSPSQIALGSASEPSCPDSSRIGTVTLNTPLLPNPLGGSVYLASQNDNPFGSVLAAYIVVDDPATGVVVKIPGKIELGDDGQITGTFEDAPQFPFSNLEIRFFGGAHGDLATPESCGTFTATSSLTPWSGPDASPSSNSSIDSGCGNAFAPAFSAGTTNPQAGAYSPFMLSLSRADGEQELAGLSVSLPTGLLAKIAGVPLCSDGALAEAAAKSGASERANPSCPAGSRIGSVQTAAGPGPDPLEVPGAVYLTGPYKGAPYGLAVVVPALAGPFDLGTVVVRQALEIDRNDAHVTDISDPFPTVLAVRGADGHSNGFPLRLRRVAVTIDRPGFTFNPTSCAPKAIVASATSTSGTSAPLSSYFQAGACAALSFNPGFSVSTQASTGKANGASLHVKVTSGSGQANIAKVRVSLPRQLPSRLTTLQKACTDSTFNANPALCPSGSLVGVAKAVTPVLANPLTGPAYLVSHGGAAFPDLVIVLQGEGIVLNLDGNTNIKKGITTSTFNTVPDAPISSFELSLPEGPHSVLAANLPAKAGRSFCGQKLTMPTAITGHNGRTKTQTTVISVTGCHKHKAAKRHHRRAKRSRHRGH